ncbi:hypothetical protein AB0E10_15440 [Streptomyces sp. NPDC048045]|uniref:hypothetical protein n=1 Tax=Streptomyces sp. NPDC048045 TaxID=3154710 RepID=UPI00341C47A9
MGSTVVRHDPTSAGLFGAISRPMDRQLMPSPGEQVGGTSSSVREVLVCAALVALAVFSGSRDLHVGTMAEPTGDTTSLSLQGPTLELTEQDSPRALVSRAPPSLDEAAESGSLTLVTMDQADPAGLPPELELALADETGGRAGDQPGSLLVRYAENLYKAYAARQLADHTVAVLEALLADPDRPVMPAIRPNLGEALDFLPGQHSDLASGGQHRPGELVRSWVHRTPGATAILDPGGASLTYAQLGRGQGGEHAPPRPARRPGQHRGRPAPVAWLFGDRALPTGRVEERARAHEAALRLTDDAPGTDRPAAGPGADELVNDETETSR